MCLPVTRYHEFAEIMHELRIAEDLISIVTETATEEGLKKVAKVSVCFGEMVQIDCGCFEVAFSEFVKGTIAENAEIDIEIIPVTAVCNNCKCDYKISNITFTCPECGSGDICILSGKELFIKSIEGD